MNRLEHKHPLAIRWFHWINFPVLAVMIWSGILIYWANDVYRIGFGNHTLFHFFPNGFYHPGQVEGAKVDHALYHLDARLADGMAWHFWFMWIFAINGIAYVLYTAFSGQWRYLLPNRNTLREALQVVLYDIHVSRKHPPRRKFNGAQQIAYTMVIVMGLFSLLSGLVMYKPVQFAWLMQLLGGYSMARFIHFWLTIGYVVFFLIHVVQVAIAGWNNFRAMITGCEVVPPEGDSHERRTEGPGTPTRVARIR